MWPCFQLVWTLYCDIVCLDYGGNVTDACVLSLLAALNNSKTHASAFNAGNSIFLDLIFIQKLKMWVQSSWQVPIHAHPCTRYNWLLHCVYIVYLRIPSIVCAWLYLKRIWLRNIPSLCIILFSDLNWNPLRKRAKWHWSKSCSRYTHCL